MRRLLLATSVALGLSGSIMPVFGNADQIELKPNADQIELKPKIEGEYVRDYIWEADSVSKITSNIPVTKEPPKGDQQKPLPYVGFGPKRSLELMCFPVKHPIKLFNTTTFPIRHPLVFAKESGRRFEPYQPFANAVSSGCSIGSVVILGAKKFNK